MAIAVLVSVGHLDVLVDGKLSHLLVGSVYTAGRGQQTFTTKGQIMSILGLARPYVLCCNYSAVVA